MATTAEKPAAAAAAAAESDSDDDCPALENVPEAGDAAAAIPGAFPQKKSRSEKKSKKAMGRLGMRPVPGIRKVTIRRGKGVQFVIQTPEVFRSPATETFIIFGEAKVEDFSADSQRRLVEQITAISQAGAAKAAAAAEPAAAAPAAAADASGADEDGLAEDDIQVVMSSARCDRAGAVAALKKSGGDLVKAIMSLTM